jgi:hypothetical protein
VTFLHTVAVNLADPLIISYLVPVDLYCLSLRVQRTVHVKGEI